MSEAQKPRKFWRLHLSTALLLMILAGGIAGLNLVDGVPSFSLTAATDKEFENASFRILCEVGGERSQYGWPFVARELVHPLYTGFEPGDERPFMPDAS